jgi:hypothetical protein
MLKAIRILAVALAVLIASAIITVYAQSWSGTTATGSGYECVGTSANGMIVIAASSVYTPAISTNYGSTWNTNSYTTGLSNAFNILTSSADGTKWAATFQSATDFIYVSTNSGRSWAPTASPSSSQWEALASSANGGVLAGAIINGTIYYSTNGGLNWLPSGVPTKQWEALSMSADGTRIMAAANGDAIYALTNFGGTLTWGKTGAANDSWKSIAGSVDESRLVASSGSGTYVSTNAGANWALGTATNGSVTSSADGSKLAVFNGHEVFSSSDYGNTWVSNNWSYPYPDYSPNICSSADGNRLFLVFGGPILTCQLNPSGNLNISQVASSNVMVSWLVPSTNFVLQQNSNLATTQWIDVTNVSVLNLTNLQNQVMLPLPASGTFYRLRTQ